MAAELEAIGQIADGGGAAASGAMAVILWRILHALQATAKTSAAALNHARSATQAAKKHYETEEELYASLKTDHAVHQATAEMRASLRRDMVRLRAKVESLEARRNLGEITRPINITDDEDTG